jgi:signal transduction histidine kinase
MAQRLQDNITALEAFVANASHEMRTPLTAIKLNVDALADGAIEDPEVSMRFLNQIQDEIDRLNRMVNDMLDLSRIEANRDKVQYEDVDLIEVLSETREFWRVRAQRAEIELRLSLPVSKCQIQANEDQIRRVFNNLIDNSIKHTPAGGWVEIGLFVLPQRGFVRVEIRDTGPGIPAEHLPRIFERFYRVEIPHPQKTSGSGLGLAIAKSIIESHRGKIGVSSKVGMGTTFWIEIPEKAQGGLER